MTVLLRPGCVALASVAMVVGCSGEPGRSDTGEVIEAGEADIVDVRLGDCVIDETEFGGSASSIEVVPCDVPHTSEVYFIGSVVGIDQWSDEQLVTYSKELCADPFEAFVGVPIGESDLDAYFFYPQQASWDLGDREVTCYVWVEGEEQTASLEGTGR